MLGMTYWVLSSNRTFSNDKTRPFKLQNRADEFFSRDSLFEIASSTVHAVPILILFFLAILDGIGSVLWDDFTEWLGFTRVNDDMGHLLHLNVDYWSSISGIQQKRWFTKELHFRNELGISLNDDAAFEKLRTTKASRNPITNNYSYDILVEEMYADAFMYTSVD